MEKFLITMKSGNRITGPIMLTTSPRSTCPAACPFSKAAEGLEAGLCYAEHGHLGHYIWTGLDRARVGEKISNRIPVHSFGDLVKLIGALPDGALWRHNQAGDLPSVDNHTIDRTKVRALTRANRGRRGFTYTHFDVRTNQANRDTIREANAGGFTINLSANSLNEADALADTKCAPVTVVVPATQMTSTTTPNGRKVVICPARTTQGVTCFSCGICAVAHRRAIIAFPALGPERERKR
ncbi:MAG TPA: hypothetical protein VMF32_13165 [Xanthobacteraceae bacterium]|nr:hypothetical protein [Xanthobacteraceae bacterium]